MDFQQLKEFLCLADSLSFGETSKQLNIPQPTLSRHLHQLEEELGAPLFERTSRKVRINTLGEQFVIAARKMMDIHDDFQKFVQSPRDPSKSIVLCHPGLMEPYGLASHLRDFQLAHPEWKLSLWRGKDQVEALLDGRIDFLITTEGALVDYPDIAYFFAQEEIPVLRDVMACVLNRNHLLAKREFICISDLEDEHLLLAHPSDQANSLFYQACREAGFRPEYTVLDRGGIQPGACVLMTDEVAYKGGVGIAAKRPAQFCATPFTVVLPLKPELPSRRIVFYRKMAKHLEPQWEFLSFLLSLPPLEEEE